MVVMGLDGGMTRLGYATVSSKGDELKLISYGVIENPSGWRPGHPTIKFNDHLNVGIHHIADTFPRLLSDAAPSFVISETIPAGKLGSNDSLVIAAVTTCKVIAHQFGYRWMDIAASTAKKQLTGDGRAKKTLIRNTVFDVFPHLEEAHKTKKTEQKTAGEKVVGIRQDAFDAVGIAIVGTRMNDHREEVQEVQEA